MKEKRSEIKDRWLEFRELVDVAELVILDQATGNNASGPKARRALRMLRDSIGPMLKASQEMTKENDLYRLLR